MELTIEQALQQGVTAHKEGKLQDAERLYRAILQSQPLHPDANHNLGVLAVSVNKTGAALPLFKTALEANPKIEQFWLSYIDALIKEKQFENAKQIVEQARKLRLVGGKVDALEAELGVSVLNIHYIESSSDELAPAIKFREAGKFQEAQKWLQEFIGIKPNHAEAHKNLGNTLLALGKLHEAEAIYTQAIALKPNYAEAHSNLGATLHKLGRLDEALASCKQAIALKSDFAGAMLNLSMNLGCMGNLEAEICAWKNLLQIDSDNYGLRAGVNLAICNFLKGDFSESKKHLLAATKIQEKTSSESEAERVYWRYLVKILKWHEDKYLGAKKGENDKILYVIGESHSLTSHHLRIQYSGIDFFCCARLIKGCKQWHLGNAFRNQFKHKFESVFIALPKHSHVLLTVGEIDCRLESGIIAHKKKFPEKQIKEIIQTTVENYLTYIVNNNSDCQHNIIIQGVPCPNIDIRNHAQKDIKQLVEVINIFNCELKTQSKGKGFGFLDTHQLTNNSDGLSNSFWHIDDYHLSPEGMQEAWRSYASEYSYE